MEDATPMYQYRPILADEEMRVLKLEPAASLTEPLVASLFVRKMEDVDGLEFPMPTYQGVSYCWGTSQDFRWLTCDGQHLKVTAHVDEMLRHLRKVAKPRNLWIDAICIDQDNNTEKAKQVVCMGWIYERADKVLVWLGPAREDDQIPSVFAILRNWALDSRQSPVKDFRPTPPSMLAPLNAFISRPWFTRRWVLQEVGLAHAVVVHCGHHRLSWAWICDSMAVINANFAKHDTLYRMIGLTKTGTDPSLAGIAPLLGLREETGTIFELLWNHHTSVCADERDRLFALYAMTRSASSLVPGFDLHTNCPVDYTAHFTSVYTRLAATAIRKGQGHTILSHGFAFGNLVQQNPAWPSWVPSWNKARKVRKQLKLRFHRSGQTPKYLSLIKISGSETLPMLRLDCHLFRITATQVIGEAGGTMELLKTILRSSDQPGLTVISREVVAAMLLRSIEISETFYGQSEFQHATVLPEYAHETGVRSYQLRNSLLSALRKELQLLPSLGEKSYSQMALQAEVDRLLQGHTLFRYEFDGQIAPGISVDRVETEDYVVPPYSLGFDKSYNISLVVRPQTPRLGVHHAMQKFCLIGYCVDYDPWDHGKLAPRKLSRHVIDIV
jgi:hypothetical protein